LDYANARYYKPTHGRFTSTDPLLTTGRLFNPQTWNRYLYVLNNPLVLTDPTGMYDCKGSEKECSKFAAGLQKANEQLSKIEKRYGKDSTEYKDAVRGLKAYGTLGDKNGVTVQFGALAKGTLGQATGSLDANGNKSINVTIDLAQNGNNSDFMTTIAHEGSHVQDHADYQDALIAAGKIGTEEAVNKVLNGGLNVTHGVSETRAFGVSSVFAEFTLGGSSGPQMGGGTFVLGGDPEKSITVGGESIWKSSWQKLDIEKIRANRSAAIEKGLKKDPIYAPKLNKPIE
jgi:hypothetical protein